MFSNLLYMRFRTTKFCKYSLKTNFFTDFQYFFIII